MIYGLDPHTKIKGHVNLETGRSAADDKDQKENLPPLATTAGPSQIQQAGTQTQIAPQANGLWGQQGINAAGTPDQDPMIPVDPVGTSSASQAPNATYQGAQNAQDGSGSQAPTNLVHTSSWTFFRKIQLE